MPQLGNFFINATTFSAATTVFIDAALTTAAADGYYSDGTINRLQSNGILGNAINCPNCLFACNNAIGVNSTQGIYELSYDAGNNAGCLVIWFKPNAGSVSGVRMTYDSNEFNRGTSENYGFFTAATQSNFVYLGLNADDCGIAAQLGAGGYAGLDEFVFDGTNFNLAAAAGVVTGNAADVQTEAANMGWCTFFTSFTPGISNTILAEIASVCASADWDIEIPCPVTLTGVSSSLLGGVCGDPKPQTFYNVPNRSGQPGVPAVNEFFVRTSDGDLDVATSPANAGDFCIENINGDEQILTVNQYSVITNIVNCP